jgi:lipoprotein-anchoring transpeptidase ErfK/SrfK
MSNQHPGRQPRSYGWVRAALLLLAFALSQLSTPALTPIVAGAPLPVVEDTAAPPEAAASALPERSVGNPEPAATVVDTPAVWHGHVGKPANVRSAPQRTAPVLGELQPGTPVTVLRWAAGDMIEPDNPTWAEIAAGQFVYGMLLQPDALPAPRPRNDAPTSGTWIAVDTTNQIATAYEGARPVHSTYVSTGRPGWETPMGNWHILRRVERETMDGKTLGSQGPGGVAATYHVENVRWTQYFTADGSAIHENYWRDPATFGIPGSHGCVGMSSSEAAWFWQWADVGTLIVVSAS